MTAVHDQPIAGPGAWKASDFPRGADDIAFDLGPQHRAAIAEAMEAIGARGLAMEEVTRRDFALPDVADELAALAEAIDRDRGIALIRGFPVDDYSQADIETIYWGIGTHFGTPVSQSVMGDHLGHVVDVTDVDPHARAYRARQELSLHTDLSDIACLLCIHPAGAGGLSRFASALAIHNEMLATRPDLLEPLYRGFRWHRLGEQGADEDPITPHRVPHFSYLGGRLSCRYVRNYIREAAFALGEQLDDAAEEAFDTFDEIGRRPDFQLEFTLRRGEAVFMNNLTVLHARTAFENHGDPTRKRHLMRLWLASHTAPAVVPEIQIYSTGRGGGVPKQEDGRMPSFERNFDLS
jgi:hypothetical protein